MWSIYVECLYECAGPECWSFRRRIWGRRCVCAVLCGIGAVEGNGMGEVSWLSMINRCVVRLVSYECTGKSRVEL